MDPHEYETHEIRSSDKQPRQTAEANQQPKQTAFGSKPFTVSSQLMDAQYLVTLKSGRTFVLYSGYDVYEAAYDAYDEACLMDDYLVDVEPIE